MFLEQIDRDYDGELDTLENSLEDGLLFDGLGLPPDHRSGFVAVVGRPNVGKSTLMNTCLGQKVAIVSPKAQTTRSQLLGIVTHPEVQVVFVDTPGIHTPHNPFGEYMVRAATKAIPDADIILWLVDGSNPVTKGDHLVAEILSQQRHLAPLIIGLNKIDLLDKPSILKRLTEFSALLESRHIVPISATKGINCGHLLQEIIKLLPLGPRYFSEDQVTDQHLRSIAAEMVREAALKVLQQEIPHAIAVQVVEFKPRSKDLTYIAANILVERDSQKKIVIGKQAQTLKKIGRLARIEIKNLVDTKIYLKLNVKVFAQWRKKKEALAQLGYATGR